MKAVMFNTQRILNGTKTAVLTAAVNSDTIQESEGATWQPVGSGFQTVPDHPVHAVNHFGRYISQTGELSTIRDLNTGQRFPVQIISIELVQIDQITDDQIRALGYPDRDAWDLEWGEVGHGGHGWLMTIMPVAPDGSVH